MESVGMGGVGKLKLWGGQSRVKGKTKTQVSCVLSPSLSRLPRMHAPPHPPPVVVGSGLGGVMML